MEKKDVIDSLKENFSGKILNISIQFSDEIILIESSALLDIAKFLKEDPYNFDMLLDLTCVDYPQKENRFEMVYHLYSLIHNIRLRFKASLPSADPVIGSLTYLWKNANWLEREVFDMFGVKFDGHPDLRRIFMYDGFEGYPLRKDYPLRKEQPRIRLRK